MRYPNAAGGLKMLFLAQILAIVSVVVIVVGSVLSVVSLGLLSFVVILGSLLAIAVSVIGILGLSKAGADDEGYRGVIVFVVVSLVLGIVADRLPEGLSFLGSLLGIVESILSFLVVNAVCQTTSNLLYSQGNNVLAERGATVCKLYLICTAVDVVCTVVGVIPIVNILAGLAGFVGSIVAIVGYILYLSFLSSSSNAL